MLSKTKYLRGFQLAVRMQDKRVLLRNGTDLLTPTHEDELHFANRLPYERIVIAGKGYLSTDAIKRLSDHNVNIILLDSFGGYVANISKAMSSNIATETRIAQYDTFRDGAKVDYLQKQIVKAKIQSEIRALKELRLGKISELEGYLQRIETAKDTRDLLKLESWAGNLYFHQYATLFDKKYGFESRRGGGLVASNSHASDPVNALLSYGYSVLAGELAKFAHGYGLDPYYGFYHKRDNSFMSLVYDLMEPFRYLVDLSVTRLTTNSNHKTLVRKYEYTWTGDGEIILSEGLIKRYLAILSKEFQSTRLYSFSHGAKRKDGFSMCQEITIAKIAMDRLTRFCRGQSSLFEI